MTIRMFYTNHKMPKTESESNDKIKKIKIFSGKKSQFSGTFPKKIKILKNILEIPLDFLEV